MAALFEKGSIFLTESWFMGGKGNDLFNLTPPTSPLGIDNQIITTEWKGVGPSDSRLPPSVGHPFTWW